MTNTPPRSPGTIRNSISPLRKLLADAVRQGLFASSPAAKADLPPTQEFIGKELPPEHSAAIRQALHELAPGHPLNPDERDPLWVCYFDLALGTGLRQGELRALQWADINRPQRLIRIERAYSRNHLKRPKSSAGIRTVPLFPTVQQALTTLAERALAHGSYGPQELLFQTERGTP